MRFATTRTRWSVPEVGAAEVTAFLRAAGPAVHKPPEQLEVVDALPRDETPRDIPEYRLGERFTKA